MPIGNCFGVIKHLDLNLNCAIHNQLDMPEKVECNVNQTILDMAGIAGDGESDASTISFESELFRQETSIAWRNLRFEANGQWFSKERKVILNRLNGYFEYHSLNAFMGPSGAGKTTLLNCLNGNRVKGLTPESEIYLNKDQRDGKVVSYFIEQHVERTIVGRMRVGQILRYAYRFKNGNEGDMEGHIRKTIDELLLDELVLHRNFEQCSGGEQKRVAIAQELMSLQKPTLLFVDEPTTGLDSNAAHLVMKCLRQLATNHRMAIITSIHVPSDDILTLFDKLYVLAKGGVCIYSGRPDQLRSHLDTQIESLVIPKEQPPIEALTKIACSGIADPRVVSLSSHTLSEEYHNVSKRLPELASFPNGVPNTRKFFSFNHLLLQTCRMFQITFVAQIHLFLLQLLVGGIYLLFVSSLFNRDMVEASGCYSFDTDNSTVCSNSFNTGSLAMQNVNYQGLMLFYCGIIIVARSTVFANLTTFFENEHRNQWYSVGVYFCSATIVGTIQTSLFVTLYSMFGYLYSGQHYVDNYEIFVPRIGYFLLIYLILAIYIDCFGQLIGTLLVNQLELSVILSLFVYMFIALLYGFFIDLEFINVYALSLWARISGSSFIFKSILYYIYVWKRCEPEEGFSLVLINYHIEPKEVPGYPLYLLLNIFVIRLIIFAFMLWRFNTFGTRNAVEKKFLNKIIQINIENKTKEFKVKISNRDLMITKRNKSKEEIEFELYSRGKIIVAWRDLSLYGTNLIFERTITTTENSTSNDKAILKNLNGEFRFGTLNALMGTSGAGKTSLLKVLNGRDKTRISPQSQFYLSKFTRIQTCFITQDVSGHLLPGLTASQMLVYASRLKNSELRECGVDTSKIDYQQIALNLLDELDLSDTVNTPVEKCSGGERKRLALALELTSLRMPNLICIDEPTSGLDSNSAEVVVACLRKLTQTHSITIVASIHQPTTEVLLTFDQCYVLARGGVCIYSGSPTRILPRLQIISGISSLDSKFPIESLIKQSCRSFPDPIVLELISQNDLRFTETIVRSGLLEQHTQQITDGIQLNRRRFSLEDTWILCLRYLAYIRGYLWLEMLAYVISFIIYGIFLSNLFDPIIAKPTGCVFLDEDFNNTCTKTEAKLYEDNLLKYNFQYLFIIFCMFIILFVFQTSITFSRESIFFFNEHRNGWYSSGTFYLMKTIIDTVPIILLLPLYVYICDIYESVRPGIYFHFLLVMILSSIAYQGVGHIISLVSGGNINLLIIILISLLLYFTFLSNFFVPVIKLHYIQRMMSHLSISRFMIESVIILLYGYDRCQPKQAQPLMYLMSLEDSDYSRCLIALVLNLILYRMIAIGLLQYRSNTGQNRRNQIERVTSFVSKLRPTSNIVAGIDSSSEFRIKLIRF